MTPEQMQRLDRRTWQLFNGYLDGPIRNCTHGSQNTWLPP